MRPPPCENHPGITAGVPDLQPGPAQLPLGGQRHQAMDPHRVGLCPELRLPVGELRSRHEVSLPLVCHRPRGEHPRAKVHPEGRCLLI